jgi:cellulase (glycosyl hydrolase family 5)/LysM domain-containing protein
MPFGNGVNLQPSYSVDFNNGDVDFAWDLMSKIKAIETVRIEIEPDKVGMASGWIQQACSRGYDVIATYHDWKAIDPKPTDDPQKLMDAANWWANNYAFLCSAPTTYRVKSGDTLESIVRKYYGSEPFTDFYEERILACANLTHPGAKLQLTPGQQLMIPASSRSLTINIMNEWGSHDLSARTYAESYNRAIKVIRNSSYRGPLIIDLPGSGQETAIAASAAKGINTGGIKIDDADIIFSAHFYNTSSIKQPRGSSSHKTWWPPEPADLDDLASAKRPCIVGEFGSGDRTGTAPKPPNPAKWDVLVKYAKTLHWPVLGWAWNGCGYGMNMVNPPWNNSAAPPSAQPPSANEPYYSDIVNLLN